MIFGAYGKEGDELPRVLHLSVARPARALPRKGERLDFLVSIHEEGTGITWQQNASLGADDERFLLDATEQLYGWSLGVALGPDRARRMVEEVGSRLWECFVGDRGAEYLLGAEPTALLLGVDETILNLPWELMRSPDGVLARRVPMGRVVTTRAVPRPGRDPLQQDREVRILAVVNPTADLTASAAEMQALERIRGGRAGFTVEVDVLEKQAATRDRVASMLAEGVHDIVHFAGHAAFDPKRPEQSAVRLADGLLTAGDVLALEWKAPPGLVFNSACESGRAAGGRRLVSRSGAGGNGLAAAFLAAGAAAYAGYFWPVSDEGARLFAHAFYEMLFERENVGVAFLEARQAADRELGDKGDLTAHSAVLFGDAASKHRRDLAMAV